MGNENITWLVQSSLYDQEAFANLSQPRSSITPFSTSYSPYSTASAGISISER